MDRRLSKHFLTHFRNHRQMLFLSGPRQVGKTTLAKDLRDRFASGHYFNWDDPTHRELILKGPGEVALRAGLEKLRADLPLCVFDELHKYRHWRDFLKGFFDLHESHARTLVTGSASLATLPERWRQPDGTVFSLHASPGLRRGTR